MEDDEIYIDEDFGTCMDDEFEGSGFMKGKKLGKDMYFKLQIARIKKQKPGISKKNLGKMLLGLPRVRKNKKLQVAVRNQYGLGSEDKAIITAKKGKATKSVKSAKVAKSKSKSKSAKAVKSKSAKVVTVPTGTSKKELASGLRKIAKALDS